ncbi:MAG: inner membrane-spanning protein YciB [Sphingomonadaceae bacterium]
MNDASAKPPPHGLTTFLLDFGPLLSFFIAYQLWGVIVGTAAFMVAILVAVAVSLVKLGRVSAMMWLSAVLVIGFGGLTIWLNDPKFIQLKPTLIYAGFSLLLFFGLATGRPLLKYVFGTAFAGLSEEGWLKLTRNWALFFAAMAGLNEALRVYLSFETWLTVKVWGVTALSLIFAIANLPMLMRHGFSVPEKAEEPPVPPQG